MFRKLMILVGAAVAVSLISLSLVTGAFAASDGSNPESALPINGTWATLNPGGTAWYGFQYAGDASQIQVILNEQGQSGLAFGVWTPELIKQYEAGQAVNPIGMGAPNVDVPADLFWTGNFDLAATYFVRVDNTGQRADRLHPDHERRQRQHAARRCCGQRSSNDHWLCCTGCAGCCGPATSGVNPETALPITAPGRHWAPAAPRGTVSSMLAMPHRSRSS